MKAYILTESDFEILNNRLELEKLKEAGHYRGTPITKEVEAAHKTFNYVVRGWIQEMKK